MHYSLMVMDVVAGVIKHKPLLGGIFSLEVWLIQNTFLAMFDLIRKLKRGWQGGSVGNGAHH